MANIAAVLVLCHLTKTDLLFQYIPCYMTFVEGIGNKEICSLKWE